MPDRQTVLEQLTGTRQQLGHQARNVVEQARLAIRSQATVLQTVVSQKIGQERQYLDNAERLLTALDPASIIGRGYAVVRQHQRVLRSTKHFDPAISTEITVSDVVITIKAQQL